MPITLLDFLRRFAIEHPERDTIEITRFALHEMVGQLTGTLPIPDKREMQELKRQQREHEDKVIAQAILWSGVAGVMFTIGIRLGM